MNHIEEMTAHRRALHMIPELDRDLPETRKYILEVLKGLDCEVAQPEGGICAYFDRGREGTVAFRADMDALPIQEKNTCDYRSIHDKKMHACGHDGHMALLLGTAQYVDGREDLTCNVLCIFQPAEETTGGAKAMCEAGILEKYRVCRVFGAHMWPFLPEGKVASIPGPMMPGSSEINVEIEGKAAHATDPSKGIDALHTACTYIDTIYRELGSATYEYRTVMKICRMESGTARNILSAHSSLKGTMRAFSDEDFNKELGILESVAADLAEKSGCKIDVAHSEGYPVVVNDERLYDELRPVFEELPFYEEMDRPIMISEDYSFYGKYAPSVFFLIGTGTGIPLHNDRFDFDEKVLGSGLELYKRLLYY